MNLSNESLTLTPEALWPLPADTHYEHLLTALPHWLVKAPANRRKALRNAAPLLRDEFRNASSQQHAVLKRLNAAYWTAQTRVDERLAILTDAHTFAEPLLREAIRQRHGLDLDVKNTFLRLYIPATIPWFPVKSGAARTWTVSLLDAALHNFEAAETTGDAYEAGSAYITPPSASGQFDLLSHIKDKLSIAAFTRLCRELDIGKQYQTWLEDNLGIRNPVVDAVLRPDIKQNHQAALRLALELALLQKTALTADACHSILGIVDGIRGRLLNGKTLLCHDLSIMSAKLTGIVLFAPDLEHHRGTERVVAYIPDDPQQPIKEYASTGDFMADLSTKLRSSDYQHFFSRFVDHEDRGHFFGNLNSRLTQITWHPHEPGDPRPSWRESAVSRANLQLVAIPIAGDLWEHLHQSKLDKILNDARTIAVSTASANRKARWALWDSFSNIVQTLLQVAAFVVLPFIPVLGEMMMAYMVYQLLDEVFEAIIDWSQGITRQAIEHTLGVVEALVQLGVFAAGGSIVAGEFRNVLPKEWVAFIDRFLPVKSTDGRIRYWDRNLKPYEQNIALAGSRPDKLGLHALEGKKILPLADARYAVTLDTATGRFQIDHPTRPGAYKPRLQHNGSGAWHTELEHPLKWGRTTLLRRIGHAADSLSDAELEQVLRISGHDENSLRRMHVDHESPPPLLADTLARFKIDKEIQTFIERIGSHHTETYLTADPQTQLQLLTTHLPWPETKGLRLRGNHNEVLWQYAPEQVLNATFVEVRIDDGDVLKSALGGLTRAETKALLKEPFGTPPQSPDSYARILRNEIARVALTEQSTLFDSRYRALEREPDPLTERLIEDTPGLPDSTAKELLNSATGIELQLLEQGTVAPRLKQLANWAQQQVRAVRARESLELKSPATPDGERLALHSMARLPGWSGDVRIDVNRYAFNGENIDNLGRLDAPERKVMVLLENGDYQAYDEIGQPLSGANDFYTCLLQALPDSERTNLKLNIGQGSQLRQRLVEHALSHAQLQQVLAEHPVLKPHYDPKVMRLPGGGDGYLMAHPGSTSLSDWVRLTYPSFTEAEIDTFVLQLQHNPLGARIVLSNLHSEYTALSNQLELWAAAPPTHHPTTGLLLSVAEYRTARDNRRQLMFELQRCWRRQTALNDGPEDVGNRAYMLRFTRPIIGELPRIQADFSHVVHLSLEGSDATRGIHEFLRGFTGLKRLELRRLSLGRLPDLEPALANLTQLILPECGIVLTAQSQATLSSLSRLRSIDLHRNPLGRVIDVQAMNDLIYIDLSETGTTSLPPGLLSRPLLETAVFTENLITELPTELFELPTHKAFAFELGENPLSTGTRERIKAFYQQTGTDLGVYAEQVDRERASALYPTLDLETASDFIYKLPGTLEDGRAELTRLEAEYATLTSQLAAWTGNTPAVHPVSGQPITPAQLAVDQSTRDEFKRTVEKGWRRETELDDFNETLEPSFELNLSLVVAGDLPTLSANFNHVSHLYLYSYNGMTSASDGFLRCFPKLKGLTIRDYNLGNIPSSVFDMGELRALVLPECRITLTAGTASGLAGMERLDFLDLSHNPLGITPDISQMPDMATLILDSTGITELPNGLLNLQFLDIANLSNNAIVEVPADILELPRETAESINLRGNPLSGQSLKLLLAYFKKTASDFNIDSISETAEREVTDSDDSEVES
ncbi:hypothetical protein NYP20_21945 [Pseudomonas sp. N3-W]|uniref:dermonecrotic toxin domain-containing protein n=1 Tax=Pseudomonas sp. N3-W TaxID=2975049 RepID=UPI00217EA707|nr:DUF6543 domain-containing protein [Pseudomonas sp. N3-W]UWF47948.1 hypothetical protein NYP20_21945 [Pseudomonas sp. N3-W]